MSCTYKEVKRCGGQYCVVRIVPPESSAEITKVDSKPEDSEKPIKIPAKKVKFDTVNNKIINRKNVNRKNDRAIEPLLATSDTSGIVIEDFPSFAHMATRKEKVSKILERGLDDTQG